MSTPRFGRIQRTMALVPLALLSAAWTASVAGVGGPTVAAADSTTTTPLPDGTTVPTEAIRAPASVSEPGRVAPGIAGTKHHAVSSAATSGIPSAALSAYQRAETVINAADKGCHLPWQLVAAIGRVESDHGRVNGNHLDADGIAEPGIFGIALDGTHHTQRVRDTDAGQYDADAKWDRAVGPMQFIPSTWSVVGVDADGDAQRNPQDINDAALATAVYLCSGNDDLSTPQGQRSAVYRYNHSRSYVDLVLAIMKAYLAGDFTSVPSSTTSGGYFTPDTSTPAAPPKAHHHPHVQVHHSAPSGTGGDQQNVAPAPTSAPPTTAPATPAGGGGTGGGGDGGGGGVHLPKNPLPSLPSPTGSPVDDLLTEAEAVVQCTTEGYVDNPLSNDDAFDKCVYDYTH
ncbi:lytic murein transglycosylase [Nocardioides panaciterrulae]|uniref:Membrane-bound lytic murein transglycosylase B n=1 Tax=Nocardioides panaciterrulae TaxID=661492 RepID=A0A7Y9JC44_9ACTN|nr:lytic murein transglycosylase [Nocardioides panaciterrulae]NYD43492.1 membrane-bound lytic murein transglycosylase B [Nocardioides panaciterrulae]